MASCDDIRTDLVAHADHALAPQARERVEAHLAACAACKGELRLLEATGRLLGRYQVRGGPAPGLAARVRERVRAEERERSGARVLRAPAPAASAAGWRRALPWAVAAAVLLGGAGVAWRLGPGGGASSESAPQVAEGPSVPPVRAPGFEPLPPREPLPSPSADPRRQGGALAQGGGSSSSSAAPGAGPELAQGGSEGAEAPPPELLAKLEMMENLELIESMDLLESMEDPEDPTAGIDEENG